MKIQKIIFFLICLSLLSGFLNSPTALVLGILFTIIFPTKLQIKNWIKYLLQVAVVGLGFGMVITETIQTSQEGFLLTLLSITFTLSLGLLLIKVFELDKKLGHLITSGTSICGGSAIAAIAPIIKADGKIISLALGVVFLLNSVALFVFPVIGHQLDLSQGQFGMWCAVAIHDTSSVVGAALGYGDEALKVATTIKLSRVLWIIPLSFLSMYWFKNKDRKIKVPFFIQAFVVAILLNSFEFLPVKFSEVAVLISKRLMLVTLFLVGTTLSINDIREAGVKPILFASVLWVSVSILSLTYIMVFN
ncbi:putative sulfate exporter family transporter [Croceitalea sp. MTPC9]|uniref:YeiH family protein n=1 Tax=unclassified Croceitalea TaxID=2632280 RepID=UPI002B3FE49C|nr:putative sulfate exporter family transporter [Croceitalea sp. MTPC6]GMN16135.1 putative sulfate exporter family transporter [Croceitalea sp. MTPC9]